MHGCSSRGWAKACGCAHMVRGYGCVTWLGRGRVWVGPRGHAMLCLSYGLQGASSVLSLHGVDYHVTSNMVRR